MNEDQPCQRRRFQFSLRTLLMAVAAVGVAMPYALWMSTGVWILVAALAVAVVIQVVSFWLIYNALAAVNANSDESDFKR